MKSLKILRFRHRWNAVAFEGGLIGKLLDTLNGFGRFLLAFFFFIIITIIYIYVYRKRERKFVFTQVVKKEGKGVERSAK